MIARKERSVKNSSVALLLTTIFFLSGVSVCVGADGPTTAELQREINALKSKIAELETKISAQEKTTAQQDEEISQMRESTTSPALEGVKIGAGATFIIQGSLDANNTTKKNEDVTDGSYSVDLEFEKEFDDWGLGFVHLETGDGTGVEDELEVFSNVNRDAGDSNNRVNLTEVWYEHYLFDKQLTLTAGKIDPTCYVDLNEIANDECAQFLGRIFRNSPTIDFCDNNPGIHCLLTPNQIPWLGLEGQVLDADGDWEDIADNIFTTAQINLKPKFSEGLSGNYRAYGWHKHTNYTKWVDSTQRFEHKYGLGTSIDQQITDIFTVFGRYGWCAPNVYDPGITSSSGANYSLEHTWSAGFQLNGKPWNREQDHFGVAIGMVIPSDKYKNAATGRKADEEGHIEVYYSWSVNQHLALSPDLHIIWNPFGGDHTVNNEERDQTITVVGCRGQVDF